MVGSQIQPMCKAMSEYEERGKNTDTLNISHHHFFERFQGSRKKIRLWIY